MNQDILKGQWRQMQGEARKSFGKLTDNDFEVIGGHIDSFIGTVQERYGYTRDQAAEQVRKFADNFRDDYPDTYNTWYKDAGDDVVDGMKDVRDDVVDGMRDVRDDIVDGVKDVEDAARTESRKW